MTTVLPEAVFQRSWAAYERRGRVRFPLTCPVRLSRSGLERFSEHWTEEVSCEGFSCLSEVPFSAGEVLDCELTVGSGERTDSWGDLVLRCKVEVLRSFRRAGEGGFTLACRLLDYKAGDAWVLKPSLERAI